MTAAVPIDEARTSPPRGLRWLVVARAVVWFVIAVAILSFTPATVWVIGTMVGVVVVLSGLDELVHAATEPGSWRWMHLVLGLVFLVLGFVALVEPDRTFGVVALFLGWYLVAKGGFDIALALTGSSALWGLTLAVGIGQLLVGVWALGYPGRSAWLLVLWVGTGALLRGIGDLVVAFADPEVAL